MEKYITLKDVTKLKLDDGIYNDANKLGVSISKFLEIEEKKAGYQPQGAALELDAFQRQLVANGINPVDKASLVDKFLQNSSSTALFPEFIDRQVRLGMNLGKLDLRLSDTHVASEKVFGGAIKAVALDFTKEDVKAKRKTERGKFVRGIIAEKSKSIDLITVGRQIDFSYKALRNMQILTASIFFKRYGFQLRKDMTSQAIDVLIKGDGNTGSAATTSVTSTVDTWKYKDLIDLIFNFTDGHEATHIVVNPAMMQKILTDNTNFPQFQSMNILEQYMKTGEIKDFLGMTWRTHPDIADNAMLAFEKETCLKYYEEKGSSLIETDKFIDTQIQGTAISVSFNFGKMFDAACHYKTQATA